MLQLSVFQSQVPGLRTDDGLNREFTVQGNVGRKNVKWFGDQFNFMGIIQAISKCRQASVSNNFLFSCKETHFHNKGFALRLGLKVRICGTRNGLFEMKPISSGIKLLGPNYKVQKEKEELDVSCTPP